MITESVQIPVHVFVTEDALMQAGAAEIFKGGVHLTVFGLAMTCFAYNAMAFSQRHEQHLALNALVYASLAMFEARQIRKHLVWNDDY